MTECAHVAHPHRRDAARRRCGRRSPRGQQQHDPRRAELSMRMTDDRSIHRSVDRWTARSERERRKEGRKEGRRREARNRRGPVGRSTMKQNEKKSRDKQRALSPRLALAPWRHPGQERAGGGFETDSSCDSDLKNIAKLADLRMSLSSLTSDVRL